ncbi:MAG TPA: DHHA1 domain-containing protein [Bryobacteraceae bacterium]|nr:DHHA1 domain-containing protein [Bryobacteraceae bacterium]
MTERLYYTDSYLPAFDATLLEARGDVVYLDRTAFYPTSGGQLFDVGTLNGTRVREVTEEEDGRIAHHLESPLAPGPVHGEIDWPRRFDFMQQHTGQHLLSAVFEALSGFATVSVHFGEESATVDLATPALTPEQQRAVELRANEIVWENRPVTVEFVDAAEASGLRKASEREGTLRIVTIADLDRSACGGTHVRATGEIGPIVLRRLDKIRGNVRVEFLCGRRALERLRADSSALAETARCFSSTVDEVPALVATLQNDSKESAKRLRKLASDLAGYRGRELYAATTPGTSGRRVMIDRCAAGALDDETRALANAYIAGPGAVFVAVLDDPPSLLLAASEDTGLNAGAMLKELLAGFEGRGGGTPRLAQGSLPSREALEGLVGRLAGL